MYDNEWEMHSELTRKFFVQKSDPGTGLYTYRQRQIAEHWERAEASRMDPTKDRVIPWDYWRKSRLRDDGMGYREGTDGKTNENYLYLENRWGN